MSDTSHEQMECYRLRLKIGEVIDAFRSRHGNKDGIAADGSYRRYDKPLWTDVEAKLIAATESIFAAEEAMRNVQPRKISQRIDIHRES